jgi:hypothetical protein
MALAKVATQRPVSIAAAVVIIGLWVAAVVSCWIIWHY